MCFIKKGTIVVARGKDAIVIGKMPEGSSKFVHLAGFLFQKPRHRMFLAQKEPDTCMGSEMW